MAGVERGYKTLRNAVILGAGRIGRGFLAQIMQSAGYHVILADIDQNLVEGLRTQGRYTIFTAGADGVSSEEVTDYDVYDIDDDATLCELLAEPGAIAVVAVPPPALLDLCPLLCMAIARRAMITNEGLDILLCLNAVNAERALLDGFEGMMAGAALEYARTRVGLVRAVLMRMCPDLPDGLAKVDPYGVLSNGYNELPLNALAFKNAPPRCSMIRLSSHINDEVLRKIYTLNMADAALAYLGVAKGYQTAYEAVTDPEIAHWLHLALEEASVGLRGECAFTLRQMQGWNLSIIDMLANPYLGDQLRRLGADAARKVGYNDRLTGPALLCLKHGGMPRALCRILAYAYTYPTSEDVGTKRLHDTIGEEGIEAALEHFSGLLPRNPLHTMVREYYDHLHEEESPKG